MHAYPEAPIDCYNIGGNSNNNGGEGMVAFKRTANGILQNEQEIPVLGFYDVAVVGGGVAGCAAAMAAGKRGWRTVLAEAYTALGGLATLGLVNIPLDFVSGLGNEMFQELETVQGLWHRNSDPEKHKLVLDRMVHKYGVEVLFNAPVVNSIVENNTIVGIIVQTKKGPRAIMAKRVIDCSGDSDAAYYAGAETICGRAKDGMSQACSLEFTLGGVDWDVYMASDVKKKDPKWLQLIRDALVRGDLPYEVDNHLNWITHIPGRPEHIGMDEVSICLAHSRRCYPIDVHDLTRMYFEGREQADFLAKFIKKCVPGFEKSFLTGTGTLMGVRESRRIVGEYVLTASDIANLRKFDDVVCISTHGYDIHNYEGPGNIKWAPMEIDGKIQYVICSPGGFGSTTPPPNGKLVNNKGQDAINAEFEPNGYYDIPYRSLIPKSLDNLLVAGRNISTDVEAQSAIRLIMACFTMGEAAGTATAISLSKAIRPREVDRLELQTELLKSGVNIGQNFRAIPGLEDAAGTFAESYQNPEHTQQSRQALEASRGKRKLDSIPNPWKDSWKL